MDQSFSINVLTAVSIPLHTIIVKNVKTHISALMFARSGVSLVIKEHANQGRYQESMQLCKLNYMWEENLEEMWNYIFSIN